MEAEVLPRHHFKWRWNALLFRAYHDAFVKQRLLQEEDAVKQVKALLQNAPTGDITKAIMQEAHDMVNKPYKEEPMSSATPLSVDALGTPEATSVMALYAKLHSLAGMLRLQIGLQLTLHFGGQHAQVFYQSDCKYIRCIFIRCKIRSLSKPSVIKSSVR
jgi:hypothetical protein